MAAIQPPLASPYVFALLIVSVPVLYVAASIAHSVFFGPLARFPGPTLAAASRFWAFKMAISGRKVKGIHEMHKQLGPILRVGPNDLSLAAPEIISRLYSFKPFLKDPVFYDSLAGGKVESHLVALTDPQEHAKRRKFLAPLLTRSSVKGYEDELLHPKVAQALLPYKIGESKAVTADILPALRALTADVSADLTFGKTFGCLDAPNFKHPIIDALAIVSDAVPVLNWIPWLNSIPRWLSAYSPLIAPIVHMEKFCADAWEAEKSGPEPTQAGPTIISRLAYLLRDDEVKHRDNVALGEALSFIVAGTETTLMGMVGCLFELSRHPDAQARIRQEIFDLIPDTPNLEDREQLRLPSFQALQQLPFLSATIKEILRLYPPVPGLLPRVVPEEGLTVRNQFIPPGTVIGMQPYTMHRDPEVFPDPDTFNPSRWMKASDIELKAMNARFLTFSGGTRACLGEEFALAELFLTVSLFCRMFHFTPAPGSDNGMEDNGATFYARHDKLLFSLEPASIE